MSRREIDNSRQLFLEAAKLLKNRILRRLSADQRENVAVGIFEPCGFHLARDVDVEFFFATLRSFTAIVATASLSPSMLFSLTVLR
jgi:hypothetical protein